MNKRTYRLCSCSLGTSKIKEIAKFELNAGITSIAYSESQESVYFVVKEEGCLGTIGINGEVKYPFLGKPFVHEDKNGTAEMIAFDRPMDIALLKDEAVVVQGRGDSFKRFYLSPEFSRSYLSDKSKT